MAKVVKFDDETEKRMKEFLKKVYPYVEDYERGKHFYGYWSFTTCLNAILDHAEQFIKEGRVIK